ncbi:MAG: phosphate regulon sensor histidine kinase PhoR [Spongiibacteraceae bacterium]
MYTIDWKIECRNLCVWFSLAGLLGWLLGLLPWLLLLASFVYIGWTVFQLQRIQLWLIRRSGVAPPETGGMLGNVFDGIYRMHRQNLQERSKLQAEVDYLQDSLASLEDAAVMIDHRGNIQWSNRAAERLLGLRYPEDRQQQLVNLIRAPEFLSYFESKDYTQSLQIRSPHNNHYHLQINITHFGEGSQLLFARDITETNRLLQMRKDFVANVSHELRTPLTVITGYLETMSDNGAQASVANESRWRRAMEQMLNQSRRMEVLIKDLIILSRLESVPVNAKHTAVAIYPVLSMIRDEVLSAIKGDRSITITCDKSIALLGNADELHSAFANLIMNAAKYTADQGSISIRCYHDEQYLYLEVEDNGEGIDDHHLPRLTERFYRVDKSRSIDTGGTGLGLAIVKHILLRHQAELRISSSLGQGSVFTCVFPIVKMVGQSNSD